MGWIKPCKFKSCHLYMENIKWYNLNKVGFIIDGEDNSLNKLPGIYVYRLKLDNSKLYIGSATNLAQRVRQHNRLTLAQAHTGDVFTDVLFIINLITSYTA